MTKDQALRPVACPFPCGWKRLFEIIVADGAFLARSLEEGEAITEHQREVVMQMIGYAKDMALHGMKAIREALTQSDQESDDLTIAYMSGFHDGKNTSQRKPEPEPVAWVGLNLDNMAEAFYRVIEAHHSRKHPFHDPVHRDAMLALRELRGLIAYMKRNTTPPKRKPLPPQSPCEMTQAEGKMFKLGWLECEAAHGIKGE